MAFYSNASVFTIDLRVINARSSTEIASRMGVLLRAALGALFFVALFSIAENRHHRRYRPRKYDLTLTIRNHNVTTARFFRLVGVDNTADFFVAAGQMFTKTYEVRRKGYWTLFVEFPEEKYARSPRKIISRDSYSHWIMEVYYFDSDEPKIYDRRVYTMFTKSNRCFMNAQACFQNRIYQLPVTTLPVDKWH
ncbi:hypothetical protein QR680_003496 [Steinernema hermaphroditum]|uniref:Uncharacterized protein n=1 Tax=Steinernema hermaphroditum TaxID=289476 RepID=A0AA39HLY0_9BILA|nr:hypothetical protein QR680_003496 [Steinernema hermaphroditum]